VSVLREAFEGDFEPLNVVYSETEVEVAAVTGQFRATRVLELEEAMVTSESDAILVRGEWFFDAITYPNSSILDTTDDALVLAATMDQVAVPSVVPPGEVNLADGLWLAYPLTHAWGHFVLECLTRLAIFQASGVDAETNVMVSSLVPESFLEFARYVYPWARFTQVVPGASIKPARTWVIPSRSFMPGRFRWSHDGNQFPNLDPFGLTLLGAHMRESLDRNNARDPLFPPNVFLDRSQGMLRRSGSEAPVRAIAVEEGFHMVDPGTLSPEREVNLFVNAVDVVGFSGSQLILTTARNSPGRDLFFYHDEANEMRSSSCALAMCTGISPNWVLGTRAHYAPGYSEQSVHQPVVLSEEALEATRAWFRGSSKSRV
jgi:hypothetical protein